MTDSYYDSPPKKPAISFNDRFMAARHEEGCYEKNKVYIFSCLQRKAYRTMTSGWKGAPYFQEIRPGAGFKTGDFVKEKLGGLP